MQSLETEEAPGLCLLLGILQRSGTNYVSRLISLHPECKAAPVVTEDNFLRHSQGLLNYADRVHKSWNKNWEADEKLDAPDSLYRQFGQAIQAFMYGQLPIPHSETELDPPSGETPKVFVSKTPSVQNLCNVFKLFPEAKVVIVVRDGRAVVESGVRSFGWDYEPKIREWARAARSIRAFQHEFAHRQESFRVIRYEDVMADPISVLSDVFTLLELPLGRYDFAAAEGIGVVGSSDVRKQSENVHWKPQTKTSDFNPLDRFKDWTPAMHDRFNWIAGNEMRHFGYELITPGGESSKRVLRNRLLDARDLLGRGASLAKRETQRAREVWLPKR